MGRADNYVLSDPPMMPDVNLYLLLTLTTKLVLILILRWEETYESITFSPEENLRVLKLKKTQNRVLNPDNKILYSGDSPNRFYEVYRVEDHPFPTNLLLGT